VVELNVNHFKAKYKLWILILLYIKVKYSGYKLEDI